MCEAPIRDRYMDLVRQFPLRPIRSDAELEGAVAVILLKQPSLEPDEDDYLEVLGDLAEAYETEAHPMAAVSDADLLRHLIEAQDASQTELSAATGIAVSTLSEVLSGKRTLNRTHIGKRARYFHVAPDVFAF